MNKYLTCFLLTIEASCVLTCLKLKWLSQKMLFLTLEEKSKERKRAKISMKGFECGFNGILWLGLSIATDSRLRLDLFTTSGPSDCGFCLWEHAFILLKLTLATH